MTIVELELARRWLTEKTTIGELRMGGTLLSYILEDHYPTPYVKVPGQTAIPVGRYQVLITKSPRFGVDMPLLFNRTTPDGRRLVVSADGLTTFEGVRMHWGNRAEDTDGCLLTGLDRGPDEVLRSKLAYAKVFQLINAFQQRKDLVFLTVSIAPDLNIC